jgi:hypothetical protein
MSGGTAVRQPLAAIGSPLADMDYHAVAEAYYGLRPGRGTPAKSRDLAAPQVKSAVLRYLADQLSERPDTGPAVPRPSPALDPVVAATGAMPRRPRPEIEEGDGQLVGDPESGGLWPGTYADFKILLDGPAEIPGLSYGDYAVALAEVIVHSRADFAVGIFAAGALERPP